MLLLIFIEASMIFIRIFAFLTFPWLTGAIFGGEDVTNPNKFPWMVQIRICEYQDQYICQSILSNFCGGSIISKRAILTAAHCVKGVQAHETQVVLGTTTRKYQSQFLSNVNSIIIHPSYEKGSNDIAIIILSDDMEYSDAIKPISLPSQESYLKVTGWIKIHNTHIVFHQNYYGIPPNCMALVPLKHNMILKPF